MASLTKSRHSGFSPADCGGVLTTVGVSAEPAPAPAPAPTPAVLVVVAVVEPLQSTFDSGVGRRRVVEAVDAIVVLE